MTVPCQTLIRAGHCLTQDEARTILCDVGIAISHGLILDIGPWTQIQNTHRAEKILDLSHCLILPGLINGHTHATMTVFRGLADDLPLMEWLTKHIFPVEKHLTAEIVYLGALLACAEMMRTGTTCFSDMYLRECEVAKAVIQSGMRAVVGEGIFAFPSPAYPDLKSAYALIQELQEIATGQPRLRNALMPHAVYTTTPEILQQAFEKACEYDVIFKIHLAETREETEQCLTTHGKRPVQLMDDLGLLSERTVLAHAVDITNAEIARLAETGTKVVHNPESNMKLASGIAPVVDMLKAGVCVGLGTDGAASNNNLNMFSEMDSAAKLQKVARLDPTALSAQVVLDMATRNGAQCLGWKNIGSLQKGLGADLVALDLREPNLVPMYHPVSQVVYAASGGEVCLTMIEGQVVYEQGRYLTLDYPALLQEIENVRRWVLSKVG